MLLALITRRVISWVQNSILGQFLRLNMIKLTIKMHYLPNFVSILYGVYADIGLRAI